LPREPTLKVVPDAKSSPKDGWVRQAFFDQSIFYKADGHRDNCAGDAAVHQLPGRGSDVEAAAAGGRAERRYQALQDGSANPAAGRPCNRFDEGAQVDIFKKSACGIPANRPGDKLKKEIDECSRHFCLLFSFIWARTSTPRFDFAKETADPRKNEFILVKFS
jgi:hypothetical protein